MKSEDEWMLVTESHAIHYHGLGHINWSKNHLIDHIAKKQDHKHYTVDLKVSAGKMK